MREIKFRALCKQTKSYKDSLHNIAFAFSYYISNSDYVVEQYRELMEVPEELINSFEKNNSKSIKHIGGIPTCQKKNKDIL